jgi:glucose-1-phosphate cytidylyltransferase
LGSRQYVNQQTIVAGISGRCVLQVVILCGGQGTRIRDVAEDLPKPMIPIGDRPILWHIMKGYAQHGFTDFVLCLGYKSWSIKRYFLEYFLAHANFTVDLGAPQQYELHGSPGEENWRVAMVETGLDAMTGCRVKRIESFIKGDTFLLTYGDGVSDINISELVDFHHAHGKLGTVTAVRAPGRFGEIVLEDSRVADFTEKPLQAPGRISGGFFVFDKQIFRRLKNDPALVLEQAPLTQLARDGQLHAWQHDGFWHPMDNSRDYKYLNELWASGQAPWKTWESPRLRIAA